VTEGHFSRRKLPEEDGEAPHVCGLGVDDLWGFAQRLWSHPCRVVSLAATLEREGGVGHVDARSQLVVRENINLEKKYDDYSQKSVEQVTFKT